MIDPTMVPKGAVDAAFKLSGDIMVFLKNAGVRELGKLSVDLELGFRKFLDRNLKQHSRIKTLLRPGTPHPIESAFESPYLQVGSELLSEDELLNLLEQENFLVVTGTGGSGKSVLLKHIFIRYYNEPRGKIPFIVELRNLPKGTTLKDYMFKLVNSVVPKFNSEMFEYSLRQGKFVFLFDGFDEVDFPLRPGLAQEILDLTYSYGDNLMVVSSRPDEVFQGWTEFSHAEMSGFTKPQVVSLVKKLRYDRNVTKEFLRLIKDGGLYESHGSYLSNPLLCSIMLLTFDQGAEIPNKLHLFFGQTFDVLFYRHDATKGTGFRRKFKTSLPIDEFRAVFSAFSAFSYIDFGPTIKRPNARNSAEKALRYCRSSEQNPDDFLEDLCSSISLLVRDGDNFSYIHRTFQEYFFAVFLASRDLDNLGDLLERLLRDKPNDSVIQLLSDINRDRFEEEFLAPRVRALRHDLDQIDIATDPRAAFDLFYFDFTVRRNDQGIGRISSWTIGRELKYPKWHYLLKVLNEGPALALLDGYDWFLHLANFFPGNDAEFEVTPTNEMLLGSPLVDYFVAIKNLVIELDEEIKKRATTQKRLLSDTLFPTKG